ncbi:MAG TPA: hypothetical protein EYQ82_06570 [Dehalococcoidia bacterium]|nr:hypothetical protein [Dehalococcoidia bacterium]
MKVLITGALGWLGKAVAEIVASEHGVRAVDPANSDISAKVLDVSEEAEVGTFPGSITDYIGIRAAMEWQDPRYGARLPTGIIGPAMLRRLT